MASHVIHRSRTGTHRHVAVALAVALATALGTLEAVAAWPVGATPLAVYFEAGRAVVGGVAALVAPGYLLLRLAGVRGLRPSKTLVYAVAVSSAFLLAAGVSSNFLLAIAGVARPLAAMPWVLTGSLFALAGLLYARPNGAPVHRPPATASLQDLLAGVQLVLVPLLAVVTARATSGNRGATLLFVVLISVVVVQVATGAMPAGLRPFAVWSVALAVLLQMTLVSPHVWGFDIHYEYAAAHWTVQDWFWTPAESSLLSVTFLAAVYATVTGLELVWVYKLVYPVVASLVPVAVYHLADRQFDDGRVAALAPFVLVFYYGFFKTMPDKQIISLFYLVLVLVVTFDDAVTGVRKRALSVVFAAMMVLSHYGSSLLFVALLTATVVTVAVARRAGVVENVDASVVRPTFTVLVGTGWLVWFIFSRAGANFDRIVLVGYQTLRETAFGSLERTGVGYATGGHDGGLWLVYKLLHVGVIGLVSVGVVWTLYRVVARRSEETAVEYAVFSSFALLFLVSGVVQTYSLGFDRILLIALVPLAPFAFVGLAALARAVTAATARRVQVSPSLATAAFTAFLVVFLVFSTGAAFTAAGEEVPPYSINLDEDAGWPVYERSEVEASRWLAATSPPDSRVAVYNQWDVVKSRDGLLLLEVFAVERLEGVWPTRADAGGASYVYVSDRPMVRAAGDRTYIDSTETEFYARNVVPAHKVYASDHVRIYRTAGAAPGGTSAALDDRSDDGGATRNRTAPVP